MINDVIVVGASYAGLSAAMQLVRARKRVLVIDGGSPRNRFASRGHGFFGQDGRPPFDILRDARSQVAAYPTVAFTEGEVRTARKTDGSFSVVLADGREERCTRLILATGVRDELPAIPGLLERWGVSVLHCPYCHGYEVAGLQLGVLATQPMSAHQAELIPDWGPTIYFTQGVFEPGEDDAELLAARDVRIERNRVIELLGAAPKLEAVRLADGTTVPIATLFIAPRTQMASPLAEQLGCAFDEGPSGAYIRVDDWRQTSVPGVYAAGDAATPMHSATLASASGALAGVGAHQSLLRTVKAAEAAHL